MCPLPAQGLDHRVQPAELFAEPAPAGRRRARLAIASPATGRGGDRRARAASAGIGRGDLDHGPGPKTEEPPAADLARCQDHGVAAQVPAHARQRLLHRLGPVGFRSH